MSYSVPPVVLPDFGATWQRGQAINDQRENNALARMMQMRQFEQQQQFENVLAKPGIAQGLMSNDPSALAAIGQFGGPQGFQMVMPLIRQQREEAMIQQALAGLGMGGAPAPAAPPAGMPAPGGVPPILAGPLPPAGGDVRERNARFAALRQQVMDDPNLTAPQREAALARISAEAARASGLPVGPGYRAPDGVGGVFAGLPPPTGQVGGDPVAPAAPAAPARPGGAMPTMAQVSALLASGNPRLVEIAKAWLPIITRDPSFSFQTIGGRVFGISQRDPTQRIDMGPAEDPQTPFGTGTGGRALAVIERLAPAIANGSATEPDVRRYLSAVAEAQRETTLPDGTRITPRLPAYAPGQDWVAQRYGVGQPAAAPVAPPAAPQFATPAPAAAPPTGAQIGQSGLVAEPPLPRASGGVTPGTQVAAADRTKLRQIETEAQGIRTALEEFRRARSGAGVGERAATIAGMPTPLATSYGNAALLAKGEALYNLGVLNGPDLSIIRRVLADPSTLSGGVASQETVEAQIRQIETLLEERLTTARQQFGGAAPAAPSRPPGSRPPLDSFFRRP